MIIWRNAKDTSFIDFFPLPGKNSKASNNQQQKRGMGELMGPIPFGRVLTKFTG